MDELVLDIANSQNSSEKVDPLIDERVIIANSQNSSEKIVSPLDEKVIEDTLEDVIVGVEQSLKQMVDSPKREHPPDFWSKDKVTSLLHDLNLLEPSSSSSRIKQGIKPTSLPNDGKYPTWLNLAYVDCEKGLRHVLIQVSAHKCLAVQVNLGDKKIE